MANVKSRIAQVEKEAMFRRWFYFSRFLEALSEEQIEEIALDWRFPDPLPEPLPWGMSELDGLDRKSLIRRWEESECETSRILRETAEHSEDERWFYVRHGHWPEQSQREKTSSTAEFCVSPYNGLANGSFSPPSLVFKGLQSEPIPLSRTQGLSFGSYCAPLLIQR